MRVPVICPSCLSILASRLGGGETGEGGQDRVGTEPRLARCPAWTKYVVWQGRRGREWVGVVWPHLGTQTGGRGG